MKRKAEIYDVKWDGKQLHYKLHWPSTGRFTKDSLLFLEKGKVGLTYAYSDQEILVKKPPAKIKKRKA